MSKGFKILIIDENEETSGLTASMLSKLNGVQKVLSGSSFNKACIQLINQKPDIVIMDFPLNEGLGFELLEYLGKYHSNITIIVLTNQVHPLYEKKCLELGADFFLDKTHQFHQLQSVIQTILACK